MRLLLYPGYGCAAGNQWINGYQEKFQGGSEEIKEINEKRVAFWRDELR
jgi:hypothetical protein